MGPDSDDLPATAPVADVTVPRDLSRLSVHELENLIGVLKGEILRLEQAIGAKRSTRNAADAVFKR